MENLDKYSIQSQETGEQIKLSELSDAVQDVSKYIADNIENTEIATIIITWLQKMNKKVYDNVVALEELKKNGQI